MSDYHAAGLLLQYHAPLADEWCSSLVPLSPNQTFHNMSQYVAISGRDASYH